MDPSPQLDPAAAVMLLPGLLGLARSRVPLSSTARRASWVAVTASILLILESVPHLAAAFDEAAVLAGQPTPFLTGHLIGAAVVYPLFGFSVAALALLSGRSLVHPIIGVLGRHRRCRVSVAPLAVGLLGIDALGVLFAGAQLWTAWLVVVGVRALALRRSHVLGARAAPSGV